MAITHKYKHLGTLKGFTGGLRVVCAWCKRVLVEGDASQPVSHGICPTCAKDWK